MQASKSTARVAPAEKKTPSTTLVRLGSAVAGAPLILGIILWPGGAKPFSGWPCALGIGVLALLALREFYAGTRKLGYQALEYVGYAATILFLVLATPLAPAVRREGLMVAGLAALLLVSLVAEMVKKNASPLRNVSTTWLGALYVGLLFTFAVRLRVEPLAGNLGWELPQGWMSYIGSGGWLMLYVLLTTSSVDTGAYFIGRKFGKHKLAPKVSPGKTIECSLGGFFTAIAVGFALGGLMHLPWMFITASAPAIGILAQLGDLSKSAIKREIGIKDFGDLIPGHGGVLDRFDSLIFTAPATYWLILLWNGIG
jgi:phosphatidate cytidylyltransferase